jgi:hypothetical protein
MFNTHNVEYIHLSIRSSMIGPRSLSDIMKLDAIHGPTSTHGDDEDDLVYSHRHDDDEDDGDDELASSLSTAAAASAPLPQ